MGGRGVALRPVGWHEAGVMRSEASGIAAGWRPASEVGGFAAGSASSHHDVSILIGVGVGR
jgi:hypothetical protein